MAAAALAAAALASMAAGCGGAGPARPGSQPGRTPAGAALTGSRRAALAGRYLAIARPANHRLETEVDGFARSWRRDPAAADGWLRAQAVTERWFDRRLAGIPFPPAVASIARALITANEHRIALTELEALSATVAQLRSFRGGHRSADAAVEAQVRLIRRALGLPPPEDS